MRRTSTSWVHGPPPTGSARCRLKPVEKLFDAEVKRTLDGFAVYERPRRVALLPRLLSEEEGELTPSLKTKNRVVLEKWADKVAYLFDEKGPASAD